MGMLGEASLPLLKELATIIPPVLKWSQQDTDVERIARLLERVHRVTLAR